MASFDEFLKTFTPDAPDFNADTFRQRAEDLHREELSIRDAKVTELTEQTAKAQATIQDLKARNYDLLMSKGTTPTPDPGSPDDPATQVTPSDLFG